MVNFFVIGEEPCSAKDRRVESRRNYIDVRHDQNLSKSRGLLGTISGRILYYECSDEYQEFS